MIAGVVFILCSLLASPETLNTLMTFNLEKSNTAVMTMGVLYIAIGLVPLYLLRRKPPKNLHFEALD